MLLEITADRKEAERFNRTQARGGTGPLSAFGSGGEGSEGGEAAKSGTGTERGAIYRSNLREKGSVKK